MQKILAFFQIYGIIYTCTFNLYYCVVFFGAGFPLFIIEYIII